MTGAGPFISHLHLWEHGAMTNDPAASTVTLVVAVSGLVVVGQWWLARRFARGELATLDDEPTTIGRWRAQ